MLAPTTYDVSIPLSPTAFLVSDGAARRSGYLTSVLVNDAVVATISAKQFADEPARSMAALIKSIVGVMPAEAVTALDKGGKNIIFPNKSVLRAWPDCVVVQCIDGEEFAWSSDEWAISRDDAELVIGAFLNYLAQAVAE